MTIIVAPKFAQNERLSKFVEAKNEEKCIDLYKFVHDDNMFVCSFVFTEIMCVPKNPGGAVVTIGGSRSHTDWLAIADQSERVARMPGASSEIRRTTRAHSEAHRGSQRPRQHFGLQQRHRLARATGQAR